MNPLRQAKTHRTYGSVGSGKAHHFCVVDHHVEQCIVRIGRIRKEQIRVAS